jgi:hypothetical protein
VISELEQLNDEADKIQGVDRWIFETRSYIAEYSHGITSQIPDVLDDLDRVLVPFSRVVELFREPRKRQFTRPGRTLKSMCSPVLTLRKILGGQANADEYKELLQNLEEFCNNSFDWEGDGTQRQLLHLQDLRDGGGLGVMVEPFFLAAEQLLSTSSSKQSDSALYIGTFRAITSDWNKHKNSLATQNFLLDIAWSRCQVFDNDYPTYIVDEFFSLLGNIFEGKTGPHIDE